MNRKHITAIASDRMMKMYTFVKYLNEETCIRKKQIMNLLSGAKVLTTHAIKEKQIKYKKLITKQF